MISKKLRDQFIRFAVVGGFCTLVNYVIFIMLDSWLEVNYTLASALGFITGVFTGYYINKKWTFSKGDSTRTYIYKYFLVYLFSLIVHTLIITYLVEYYSIPKLFALTIAIGTTMFTNFFGSKILVFKA